MLRKLQQKSSQFASTVLKQQRHAASRHSAATATSRFFSNNTRTFNEDAEELGPRDTMFYDVLVVGGGPAGLSTAIVSMNNTINEGFVFIFFCKLFEFKSKTHSVLSNLPRKRARKSACALLKRVKLLVLTL